MGLNEETELATPPRMGYFPVVKDFLGGQPDPSKLRQPSPLFVRRFWLEGIAQVPRQLLIALPQARRLLHDQLSDFLRWSNDSSNYPPETAGGSNFGWESIRVPWWPYTKEPRARTAGGKR